MSAIYGIIHKNGNPISQETAGKMAYAMRHRAINGEGVWQEDNIMLGQSLLIFDTARQSAAAPLVMDDIVLAADIRIDNRAYIRSCTKAAADATDQELLLAAFREWGEDCVHHLKGEFAFCIWERRQRRLFLATDHVGFRSLYYYDSPEVFIFSSEQKGLLAVKPLPHVFNEESLIAYHFRKGDPAATYTNDVYALCGGHAITLERYQLRTARYWHPSPGKHPFEGPEACTRHLQQLLTTAIRNSITTDKPVGITLSGGLDSSSIACLLARELAAANRPLYTFSSVLPDTAQGKDERAYIDRIVQHCPNIIPTYVDAVSYGPFDDITEAFDLDGTFPNPFFYMDYAILRAAKEKGIGVLFTGYGGDHWVSWQGHPVIYKLLSKGRYRLAFQLIMSFAAREQQHPLQIVKREIAPHTALYRVLRGHQRQTANGTALQKKVVSRHRHLLDFSPVKDIAAFMLENIISGRTGMFPAMLASRNEAYGMTSAVPLLDRNILEYMLDVPDEMFVHNGHKRSLLRHTMAGIVPEEILWRSDKGKYSPDFMARATAGFTQAAELMQSPDYTFIFERYLSESCIRRLSGGTELPVIRMTQAVICSKAIAMLQKNGYQFEGNFS